MNEWTYSNYCRQLELKTKSGHLNYYLLMQLKFDNILNVMTILFSYCVPLLSSARGM